MPTASAQLWRVILKGSAAGQKETVNVFHFKGTTAGTLETAAEVMNGFKVVVMPYIDEILQFTWNSTVLIAEELTGTQYLEDNTAYTGQRTGNILPAYVTAGFILRRTDRDVRNGYKRFSPLSEDDVDDQTVTGAYASQLAFLSTALGNDIVTGATGGGNIRPCILRRATAYTPTYEYTHVANADFRGIGSQVTRKQPYT